MLRAAILAAALCLLACGPTGQDGSAGSGSGGGGASTPDGGSSDGGSSGGGTASGGSGTTPTGGGPGGGGASGGADSLTAPATAWATRLGGLGVEWSHDVAVAPDGSMVAFDLVGVRGEGLEQLGFVHLDGDGRELQTELEDEGGAALHFAPTGSFAITPAGHFAIASAGRCAGGKCPTIGGGPVDGGALVLLDAHGKQVWSRALGGDVVSNVAVDGGGNLLVATGTALRRYGADGALAWERSGLDLAPGTPVAFDGRGNALYGHGGAVVSLDLAGKTLWERSLGGDLLVTALQANGSDVVVHGRFKALDLAGAKASPPAGADHGYFLAALGADGTPRWARDLGAVQETSGDGVKTLLAVDHAGRIVLVTGADACTAFVAEHEANGEPRWRRSLVPKGCGGRAVKVHGLAVTPSDVVVVAGELSASVDFGTGILHALATDGFVVGIGP
ncbi:MAG TPA: PQQ-binding-like beta-propeller repeat protein [Anaeromyxobacteraceae bacterium]|nr:PQQ-binding-like beta-propeller repeat protein [Anaeromyxobacteraceae bacterium]